MCKTLLILSFIFISNYRIHQHNYWSDRSDYKNFVPSFSNHQQVLSYIHWCFLWGVMWWIIDEWRAHYQLETTQTCVSFLWTQSSETIYHRYKSRLEYIWSWTPYLPLVHKFGYRDIHMHIPPFCNAFNSNLAF